MERESFVFYRSFYDCIKDLDDKQTRELVVAICERALDWNENEINDKIVKIAFNLIKPQIDANTKRYVDWCKWWSYWTMWWRPKSTWDNSEKPQWGKKNNPSGSKLKTPNDNDNVNDNVNENENENDNKTIATKNNETLNIGSAAKAATPIRSEKNKKYDIQSIIHTDSETQEQRDALNEAWDAYKEMRKKIKKPLTEYAEKLRAKDLVKLWKTVEERIAILNQSTASWRQDLYELKQKTVQPRVNWNMFH